MRNVRSRTGFVAAAAALALGLAACGSDSEASDADSVADGAPTVDQVSEGAGGSDSQIDQIDAGGDDYALGLDRELTAQSIQGGFATDNAEATWEGDTLVLTLDGDASAMNAGFTECRVVSHVIKEDDSAAIVFPNGRVECADVLADS